MLEVVSDLGKAAESDEMSTVSRCVERVNGRFFRITDIIRNNQLVTKQQQRRSGAAETPAVVSQDKDKAAEQPIIAHSDALKAFGGDANFFKQMCAKFIASCRGVAERIAALVEADPISIADLRREAHSMKGAASTIGAMQLSQAALDLQLAAERETGVAALKELAAQLQRQFERVVAELEATASADGPPVSAPSLAPAERPRAALEKRTESLLRKPNPRLATTAGLQDTRLAKNVSRIRAPRRTYDRERG
jgi:HPt (histidine-containing phosphotransfer) domain-containing protein